MKKLFPILLIILLLASTLIGCGTDKTTSPATSAVVTTPSGTTTAAWGAMVSEGREYLLSDPVLSIAPGGAIMLVVFAFNMVGDGLRDALDSRLRGII